MRGFLQWKLQGYWCSTELEPFLVWETHRLRLEDQRPDASVSSLALQIYNDRHINTILRCCTQKNVTTTPHAMIMQILKIKCEMVVKLKEKCQNTKKQRGPGTLFSQWKIIKGLDTKYNEMDVVLCDALTTLHRTCKISQTSITQIQRLYLCLCSVFV